MYGKVFTTGDAALHVASVVCSHQSARKPVKIKALLRFTVLVWAPLQDLYRMCLTHIRK